MSEGSGRRYHRAVPYIKALRRLGFEVSEVVEVPLERPLSVEGS